MKLIVVIFLFSSSADALIRLPTGVCTLEGRLTLSRGVDPQPTLIINEGTGAEKTITLKNPTDPRLKSGPFVDRTVKMKVKMHEDSLSIRGEAEFLELIERVPSFDIKIYDNPKLIADACEGRTPAAALPKQKK